jgi:hypothetical protein
MGLVGHVTSGGQKKNAYSILVAQLKGNRSLGVNGMITIKWI